MISQLDGKKRWSLVGLGRKKEGPRAIKSDCPAIRKNLQKRKRGHFEYVSKILVEQKVAQTPACQAVWKKKRGGKQGRRHAEPTGHTSKKKQPPPPLRGGQRGGGKGGQSFTLNIYDTRLLPAQSETKTMDTDSCGGYHNKTEGPNHQNLGTRGKKNK